MAEKRILVVEDDVNISKLIKYNLEKAGFVCQVAGDGESALDILERENFSLIILDIMLPQMDGFEVCKQIKQDKRLAAIPVMMLTARAEEIDRIVGFELGADDYVTKPFSPRELVLRVKAIIKRNVPMNDVRDVLRDGDLAVDIPAHQVTVNTDPVDLTAMEFDLLIALMTRKGRVQTREALLEDVWDIASDVTTRTVDTHIKRLRQKLGSVGQRIETVRGVGYRFGTEK
jgi:two-component system phosphate regulon response regulator PhoB